MMQQNWRIVSGCLWAKIFIFIMWFIRFYNYKSSTTHFVYNVQQKELKKKRKQFMLHK